MGSEAVMIRRKRARRPPQPELSVSELALFLNGDRALAHRVLRALRIPAFTKQPPRAPVDRVEGWLRRQRRA
jgi:hypothetical protein